MVFADYKDIKLREGDVASHAEVLAAMDCLVHHLNDEEASEGWLSDHLPDGDDRHQCRSLSWENSNIQANCGDMLCSWRGLCEAKTAINAALAATSSQKEDNR